MDTYAELTRIVNKKNEHKSFKEVNEYIDSIIEDRSESGKIKEIKVLICDFEGKLNNSNKFTLVAISYALLIGAVALEQNVTVKEIMLYVLSIAGLLVILLAEYIISVNDYKKSFILKVLNFKLEELINKNENKKGKNETSECKEYIITISKK